MGLRESVAALAAAVDRLATGSSRSSPPSARVDPPAPDASAGGLAPGLKLLKAGALDAARGLGSFVASLRAGRSGLGGLSGRASPSGSPWPSMLARRPLSSSLSPALDLAGLARARGRSSVGPGAAPGASGRPARPIPRPASSGASPGVSVGLDAIRRRSVAAWRAGSPGPAWPGMMGVRPGSVGRPGSGSVPAGGLDGGMLGRLVRTIRSAASGLASRAVPSRMAGVGRSAGLGATMIASHKGRYPGGWTPAPWGPASGPGPGPGGARSGLGELARTSARLVRGSIDAARSGVSAMFGSAVNWAKMGIGLAKGLAGPIGIAVQGGQMLASAVHKMLQFAEGRSRENAHLANYSGRLAASYQQLAISDVSRNWRLARETEVTAANLNRQVARMREAWQPYDIASGNIKNRLGSEAAGVGTIVGRAVAPVAEKLNEWFGQEKPGDKPMVVQAFDVLAEANAIAMDQAQAAGMRLRGMPKDKVDDWLQQQIDKRAKAQGDFEAKAQGGDFPSAWTQEFFKRSNGIPFRGPRQVAGRQGLFGAAGAMPGMFQAAGGLLPGP